MAREIKSEFILERFEGLQMSVPSGSSARQIGSCSKGGLQWGFGFLC